MDALHCFRRHMLQQQLWVRLCCYGAIGITLLCLFLSIFGTKSANVRSTGLMAFPEETSTSTSALSRHVEIVRQASTKFVQSIWSWDTFPSDDDDIFEEEQPSEYTEGGEEEHISDESWEGAVMTVEGGHASLQEQEYDSRGNREQIGPIEDWRGKEDYSEASSWQDHPVVDWEDAFMEAEGSNWDPAEETWETEEWTPAAPAAEDSQFDDWQAIDEDAQEHASMEGPDAALQQWDIDGGDAPDLDTKAEQPDSSAAIEQEWEDQAEQWGDAETAPSWKDSNDREVVPMPITHLQTSPSSSERDTPSSHINHGDLHFVKYVNEAMDQPTEETGSEQQKEMLDSTKNEDAEWDQSSLKDDQWQRAIEKEQEGLQTWETDSWEADVEETPGSNE